MQEQKLLYKKISTYSMVACGSLITMNQANAAHAMWTVGDGATSFVASDSNEHLDIDLDGDGVSDFRLSASHQAAGNHLAVYIGATQDKNNGCYAGLVDITGTDGYAGVVSAGTEINGSNFSFNLSWNYLTSTDYPQAAWDPTTRGFLALAVLVECSAQVKDYSYGYLDLEVSEVDGGGVRVGIGAGGGFNPTPNEGIIARYPPPVAVPVPVPVAAAAIPASLGLLALGAGAIRRRRKNTHLN